MTGNGLGLILFTLVSLAGTAAAQEQPAAPKTNTQSLAEILRDIDRGPSRAANPDSSRRSDPVWSGQAQFNALPGAKTRVLAGERKAGEVFAEIDVGPARTATLDTAVTLDHPTHGQIKLAKDTPLRAMQQGIAGGSGSDLKIISQWISWRTVEGADGKWISIDRLDSVTATFEESQTTPNGPGSSRLTGRRWSGPLPKIAETTAVSQMPILRRLSIASITDEGVRLQMDSKTGDSIGAARGMGLIKWGAAIREREQFPGLLVMFQRGASPDTATVVIGPEAQQ